MSLINWDQSFSVGVASMDAQHRNLIELLNTLHDAMTAGRAREVLGSILERLIEYTKIHFSREEEFFTAYAYPEAAQHIREHAVLTEKVLQLQQDFAAGQLATSIELLGFLEEWLKKHIKGTDARYSAFFKEHGVQ
jgi:hemerythrin